MVQAGTAPVDSRLSPRMTRSGVRLSAGITHPAPPSSPAHAGSMVQAGTASVDSRLSPRMTRSGVGLSAGITHPAPIRHPRRTPGIHGSGWHRVGGFPAFAENDEVWGGAFRGNHPPCTHTSSSAHIGIHGSGWHRASGFPAFAENDEVWGGAFRGKSPTPHPHVILGARRGSRCWQGPVS